MQFEFYKEIVAKNILDIEDIGQCAIECFNNEGMYFYLIIRTLLGTTTVATCGPIVPDIALLPSGFTQSLYRFEFNEKKVITVINKFLNDSSKKITSAKVVDIDDAISEVRDFQRYLQDYNEELN